MVLSVDPELVVVGGGLSRTGDNSSSRCAATCAFCVP